MSLGSIDYAILALYFAFVLGIGFLIRRRVQSSQDFLTAHRSVPVWITSLAFLAANLGAQEVVGMCASGAKYGLMTAHFYWLGAVPAMLFVGVFMMPFYYGSRARSVPEYLKLRFDEKTRVLNAATFAVMTLFSSGVSMYALGKLFQLVLGWDFTNSILLSAAIVLVYTFLGGLTSAIYNEVLQFFLIVLGFSPLAILAVIKAAAGAEWPRACPAVMTHTWRYTGQFQRRIPWASKFSGWSRDWVRALLRILVHGFSGGAARHGGRFDVGGAAYAADCRVSENGHAVHRDRAWDRGAGAGHMGVGLLAAVEGRRPRLRSGADHADGEILSVGNVGRRADGADGVVHERDGRQRDGV